MAAPREDVRRPRADDAVQNLLAVEVVDLEAENKRLVNLFQAEALRARLLVDAENAAPRRGQEGGVARDGIEHAALVDPFLLLGHAHGLLAAATAGGEKLLAVERVKLQVDPLVAEREATLAVEPGIREATLQGHAARGVVARQHGDGERVGPALRKQVGLHPFDRLGHVALAARVLTEEIAQLIVGFLAVGGVGHVRSRLNHAHNAARGAALLDDKHQLAGHGAAYLSLRLALVSHRAEAHVAGRLGIAHQSEDGGHIALARRAEREACRCQLNGWCHISQICLQNKPSVKPKHGIS